MLHYDVTLNLSTCKIIFNTWYLLLVLGEHDNSVWGIGHIVEKS